MPRIELDIGTGFYQSEALPLANQRCVNLYPDNPQTAGLSNSALFGTPGLKELANSGRKASDENRGAWVKNGLPYFVNSNRIYRLDRSVSQDGVESFTLVNLGEIEGDTRCSFADNGQQLLVLVPGGKGYIVDESQSPIVQEITDPDFTTTSGKPQYVVYIDGYFVVSTDESKFKNSNLNDGFTWTATDFGSAEVDPDGVVAPFVFKNQLYIAGQHTIESFNNIGGSGFPFQRVQGFVIDKGVTAPNSIETFNETILFAGAGEKENIAIWQLQGAQPVKISTTAIDNKLQDLTTEQQEAIFSWSYSQKGHYYVAFSSDNQTFVYDLTTGKWHERESNITDSLGNVSNKRCRYNSVVSAYGRLLVGDSEDGRIGELDLGTYKEYTEDLRAYFTTSPMFDLGESFSINEVEIFCQPGVGNKDVVVPVVNFRISKDGYIFSDYVTRKMGSRGQYDKRQIIYKQGRVNRYCIFEFLISDAVERRFLAMSVKYKPGNRR